MNTGNVYEHPTVSWDRARQAFEQIQRKEGELIDAWLELGRQLNVLRAKHPADQDFGAACQAHDIDLTRQHRNAAMWLASLDADQLDSLRQYNPTAIHPATLQNRCREQFPDWLTSVRAGVHSVDTAEKTVLVSENEPTEAPQAAESENKAEESDEKTSEGPGSKAVCVDRRSPLAEKCGADVAEKIINQWTHEYTKHAFYALAKSPGGPKVIHRIAAMIDDHCDKQNNGCFSLHAQGTQNKSFSHRLFVDGLPRNWSSHFGCVWTKKSRGAMSGVISSMNKILDEVPDAKRMIAELGAGKTLAEYRKWWNSRNASSDEPAGPNLSAFSKPTEDKPRIRAAEGSEHDLIAAYGVEIWPAESPSYSFDEAWAAYQLWKTEDQALSTANGFERPQARGRHFMSQCDYLNRVSKGFVTAWRKIATAQYSNPENGDDCCCPSQHINISA